MIQSQFDAAAKLGVPKTELSGTASDERPRKRRKTTPPMQDSIEVAPDISAGTASPSQRGCVSSNADQSATNTENSIEVANAICADPASPGGRDAHGGGADGSATNRESSINAICTSSDGISSPMAETESKDDTSETTDTMDDEVILLSEESVLTDKYLLFRVANDGYGDVVVKEEVLDPLGDMAEENSTANEDTQDQAAKAMPRTPCDKTTPRRPSIRSSRRNTLASQTLPSAAKPPEGCQTQQPPTAPPTAHSTPKPASSSGSGSGPQTTSSSPLSSPPAAELFDSFNEHLTEPPASSSRPSSPITTQDDEGDDEDKNENNEPSPSHDYTNRSSSFRRSLSTLKGKELFDASIWADPLKTSVFYTFATNLRQKSRDADPTGCHQFIGHLSKTGKMVRCYTQNIDLLEDKVGLSTRLLLGAGSRSRFSTRTVKGAASGLSAAGSKAPSHINSQSAFGLSELSDGSSSQPTVDTAPVPIAPTLPESQDAPAQLPQNDGIDRRQTNCTDREVVGGSSQQATIRDGEGDGGDGGDAQTDAQLVDASSANPDKPVQGTDCVTPTTPQPDRGVECVFLHGSLRALRCFQCGCVADWEGDRELQTMSGQQPPCPRCEDATNARQERGKRALGVGKLRPDIVLYGEDHPESQQISSIIQHDISLAPDMLIIMGTSLKVHGLKTVVKEFAKAVHNRRDGKVIFVNYTKPAESVWADVIDFWVEMDCDSWVADLKEKKPIIWMPPGSVENESRTATSKRSRHTTEGKGQDDKGKKPKRAKVEPPRIVVAKPVPRRPAAHRDCKLSGAYWTSKIQVTLASMVGRQITPVTPRTLLDNAAPPAPNGTQNIAPTIGIPATKTIVPVVKVVQRRPRTKNTLSRKAHEASAISGPSLVKPSAKKSKAKAVPVPATKALPKRRPKSSGPATTKKTTGGIGCTKDVFLPKQDPEATPDVAILAQVSVANSVPNLAGDDIPMVSVVKNRTRKPKVHYGESLPSVSAPWRTCASRGATPMAAVNSHRKGAAKAVQPQQIATPPNLNQSGAKGRNWSEIQVLHPIITSRYQPEVLDESNTLRPLNQQGLPRRRASFFDVVLAEPSSPEFLEPAVLPPAEPSPKWMTPCHWQQRPEIVKPVTDNMPPKLSPDYWQKQAFAYGNGLFRLNSPFEFGNLRNGDACVPGHMRQPMTAPQQQIALQDAAPLMTSPFIVPNLGAPVGAPPVPGDSPNSQLQRESEAAVYDQRQFAQI